MKIIFLDIDSVLNHSKFGLDIYYDVYDAAKCDALALDEDNIEALKKILEEVPDAKVVWTTDWRNYDKPFWNQWKNPRLWLESQDFMKDRIAGKAPCKMSSEHYHDIKWWLDENKDVKQYVILEDSYFPEKWFGIEKHLIKVNPQTGLTFEDAKRAIEILSSEKGDYRDKR